MRDSGEKLRLEELIRTATGATLQTAIDDYKFLLRIGSVPADDIRGRVDTLMKSRGQDNEGYKFIIRTIA